MIEVTATLRVWADTDEEVDSVLRDLLTPRKGINVQVVESERRSYEK